MSKLRICAYEKCNKKFVPNTHNQKYCTPKCASKIYNRKRNKPSKELNINYKKIKKACPIISSQGLQVREPDFLLGF